MKLSNKGRYALRALFDIAFHQKGGPTQVKEIAERELIPARFLEQIFAELRRAGIVGAKRGPRGGYHLARPAAKISVGDVIRAVEGPVAVLQPEDEAEGRERDAVASVLGELEASVDAAFDGITLADVCERGLRLGQRRRSEESQDYVI